jgi:hypothetical protein
MHTDMHTDMHTNLALGGDWHGGRRGKGAKVIAHLDMRMRGDGSRAGGLLLAL